MFTYVVMKANIVHIPVWSGWNAQVFQNQQAPADAHPCPNHRSIIGLQKKVG